MATVPIALQLYSVRDETEKDFAGTLRRVAEIGYPAVEFAGFGGFSAQELRTLLTDLNLQVAAAHIGVDALRDTPDEVIAYQIELGNSFVVIPWMSAHDDPAGWEEEAVLLNEIGALLKEHDLQLCYHNHAHEMAPVNGMRGLDLLYRLTDHGLVQAELDLYWLQKGGADPVEYVKHFAGREPLLHVKDMAADAEGSFTEFGTGILDWNAIFAAARTAGVHWYIVEQDICRRPSLESAGISFRNLKARFSH